MHLSENEVHALVLITRSPEPVHPSGLQKELGLLNGSISRIITGLQDIGLVELLSRLGQSPKSQEALAEESGISSDTVYYYLQGFRSLGIVSRSMQGRAYLYYFNYIIWPELKDFVTSLQEYQEL